MAIKGNTQSEAILSQAVVFKHFLIGMKGPSVCQENISHPHYTTMRQDVSMDSCC